MLNKQTIITIPKRRSSLLKTRFQFQKMGLFGPFGTNAQTADRDIDFIVTLNDNTTDIFLTKKALRHYLKNLFGEPVDLANYAFLKPYAKAFILPETGVIS